jgi:hypothetical protein
VNKPSVIDSPAGRIQQRVEQVTDAKRFQRTPEMMSRESVFGANIPGQFYPGYAPAFMAYDLGL